eukprot:SM000128S26226  [mRNA]  locus=s128:226890:228374:+ [translate_table: standard]
MGAAAVAASSAAARGTLCARPAPPPPPPSSLPMRLRRRGSLEAAAAADEGPSSDGVDWGGGRSLAQLEVEVLGKPAAAGGRRKPPSPTPPAVRMKPDGTPWSLLDELEREAFAEPDEERRRQEGDGAVLRQLRRAGEWLVERSQPDEGAEGSNAFLWVIAFIFPVWLAAVLLAGDFVEPPAFLRDLLPAEAGTRDGGGGQELQ